MNLLEQPVSMPDTATYAQLESAQTLSRPHTRSLLMLASLFALLHIATNGQYGFHRDELQFLSDARHLDWGFVAYPPLTPFLEHIGLHLFGLSLVGLRLFSVIAQAAVVFVSGLMAHELGGNRLAQIATALSVALSPLPVFEATEFQYSSFDFLWWVLIAYFTIRLLNTDNPRWWIAIGAVVGIGLLTKYSIAFLIAGILGGLILSRARRFALSGWFWAGIALALLIFLPNFLWLVHHDFISFRFLQHIHIRDVNIGRADGFLRDQFLLNANLISIPLWIAGLIACLRVPRYRMLAWMYLIPFALFFLAKGRFYYVSAAYPMLIAMGSVVGAQWLATMPRGRRIAISSVFFTGLVIIGAFIFAALVPIARSGPLRAFALKNSGDLREEIGWDELVKTIAGIRDSLPFDRQKNLGILVGNYGEQGAIEMLGAEYRLPAPMSLTNSAWLRGYPSPTPTTLIVIGFSAEQVARNFESCHLAAHNANAQGVENEESKYHPDIFVCGPPLKPWPQFWLEHQSFG